ncbi:putative E3 SUMO-protein ligase RNF212 [Mastacembelus armatus]|uniref:putative E3 SUMO-protein ligase RNF212 n=1 Tax=Mastacembelus armatus TaxID=205130 RepID=UPI000E461D1D|nr:probable E3 SUMO-protein ligase RNF212 [Mastacembelus armatus]
MSYWICCNSCFLSPSADRKLAVTTCGHVICNVCYQKGKQGMCLICNATCQVSALSDKSSSEVKALFSDINAVATKHLTEISKVIMFQARHQRRLLTHYQQMNEKLEETLVKMKQEMQKITKKMNEQSAYMSKLENCLQPKRTENLEVDERTLFRKPNTVPRLSLISPPQDGRMGTITHRSSNQNMLASHSARSATASRFQGAPLTADTSYGQSSGWKSPIFKPPSSFRR